MLFTGQRGNRMKTQESRRWWWGNHLGEEARTMVDGAEEGCMGVDQKQSDV